MCLSGAWRACQHAGLVNPMHTHDIYGCPGPTRQHTMQCLCLSHLPAYEIQEVKKLAEALSTNTVLKELCISSHAVSPQAAQQLSEMLTTNTTITTICIGDSVFGDAGVAALSPGIGASSSVTSVDMSHKVRGSVTAAAVAAATVATMATTVILASAASG